MTSETNTPNHTLFDAQFGES